MREYWYDHMCWTVEQLNSWTVSLERRRDVVNLILCKTKQSLCWLVSCSNRTVLVKLESYMYFMISLSINHFFAFSFQLVLFKLRGLGCGMHLCSMPESMRFFLSKSFTRSSTYRPMDTITVGFSRFIDSARNFVQISCNTFFFSAYKEYEQIFFFSFSGIWHPSAFCSRITFDWILPSIRLAWYFDRMAQRKPVDINCVRNNCGKNVERRRRIALASILCFIIP